MINNNINNLIQQQLRPKQHIGRSGVWGTTDCTEMHRNEGITMKTMRGSPNSIRGNGHRKTRNDVRL